jgi:hypothetical protein
MSRKTNKGRGPPTDGLNDSYRKASSQPKNSKTQSEGEALKHKIETVKAVTGWPDEDIVRVLEKTNMDPEQAMNNILDGLEKEPNSWKEVVSKRTKVSNNLFSLFV